MPDIVAICPYCRAGGVRAKDTAIGASATCPKCRSSFTIVPDELKPGTSDDIFAPAPRPRPPATEETRPAAALPDVTEPSPVLPADPKPAAAPKPTPTPAGAPASDDPAAPADTALVLGLGALILVGPAVLASQLPYGRAIGLALAGAGLAGGLLGALGEGRARLAGGAAAGLHLVAALVLLFLPSWLNLDPWRGADKADEPAGPVAVEHETAVPRALTPGEWLDAGKWSWQFGDLRVSARATIGSVEVPGPKGAKRATKEQYLRVVARLTNTGFERELALPDWATAPGAAGVRATDSAGKVLAPAIFEAGRAPERAAPGPVLRPTHMVEVEWFFAAPGARNEFVRLQLPGAGGATEEVRFHLSRESLSRGFAR